jgi:hypothetical protein
MTTKSVIRTQPWWYLTRKNAWYKANVVAATAVGVYAVGFRLDDILDWITGPGRSLVYLIAVLRITIAGAVMATNLVRGRWGRVAGAWAVVVAVLMVFAIGRAAGDSTEQRHSNCWNVSGSEAEEIVACAPGSEPRTGSFYNQWSDSGSSRYCDELRVGDGGATIWRCEQDEF